MSSAHIRIPEARLVELLQTAVVSRLARDYDMIDDPRTNREILSDLVLRAKSGDGDLLKYLTEMLHGDTHEICDTYLFKIP